ncbi:GNAT family N-acetyltransferase [Alphaproteobacteria bacterium]|nr:GNAT family N-acetyltransferase [Alphaproteobacteria bacterium]
MNDLMIRPAVIADAALLLSWVNSADSLRWKQHTAGPVSPMDHDNWLRSRLADPATKIWIIVINGVDIGQVRLEKKADFVYTDIYLIPAARGNNNASAGLNNALKEYSVIQGDQQFCALVHIDNKSSQNLFSRNGFKLIENDDGDWLKFIRHA